MNDSSLKHFDFKGWTADQILEKYESVLASREKQITDLSLEIGALNDKINAFTDENATLRIENEALRDKLIKKERLLNQELNNKEIMFMKLDKSEKEVDRLKSEYQKLTNTLGSDYVNSHTNNTVNPSNTPTTVKTGNSVQQSNKSVDDNVKNNARNKINELKAKNNSTMSKINFADLFNKKENK